jgi:hypothetical protein
VIVGRGVLVKVGGMNGVLEGVGVRLVVGVCVIVGVFVVVGVVVKVGVWLGVADSTNGSGVNDVVGVWVANTTRVKDGSGVEVPEGWPGPPGARSNATNPAQ